MANFDSYKNAFPHAKLIRSSNGVLEVVLHTNGDTLIFNGYTHEEFVDLFHQISRDAENRPRTLQRRVTPPAGGRAHSAL